VETARTGVRKEIEEQRPSHGHADRAFRRTSQQKINYVPSDLSGNDSTFPDRVRVPDLTFEVVVFSILAQGPTMKLLLSGARSCRWPNLGQFAVPSLQVLVNSGRPVPGRRSNVCCLAEVHFFVIIMRVCINGVCCRLVSIPARRSRLMSIWFFHV